MKVPVPKLGRGSGILTENFLAFFSTYEKTAAEYQPAGKSYMDFKLIKEMGWEDADRINLARDIEKWQPFANTVTNLRVP
jgi:hypothetical protein